jgi:hypothetical protein
MAADDLRNGAIRTTDSPGNLNRIPHRLERILSAGLTADPDRTRRVRIALGLDGLRRE